LILLLGDAATYPGHPGYMTQAMLMGALRVKSAHTFNDIVTRAAIIAPNVWDGSAVAWNRKDGYRLVDRQTQADLRVERGRARAMRTKMDRLVAGFSAKDNSPLLHMIGRQLQAFVASVIEPLLGELDEIVGDLDQRPSAAS
jgi:hypothetical protein